MSVLPSDMQFYGCANQTEADGVTIGGAVDLTKLLTFADLPATGLLDFVSSSASDTATKIQVAGRDSTGTIQTPTAVTLTGTTIVAGSQSFQRLLYGATSGAGSGGPLSNPGGTAAVGDVAAIAHTRTISGHTCQAGSANASGTTPPLMKLQSGDGATITALNLSGLNYIVRITGGTGSGQLRSVVASSGYGTDFIAVSRNWTTIPDATSTYDVAAGMLFEILPNPVTAVIRQFSGAAADIPTGASRTYYDKGFVLNTNAATSLTGAQINIVSETPSLPGSAALDFALANASGSGATLGLNDSVTINPRLNATPPTGTTSFNATNSAINVPNSNQSLPAGNAAADGQAVWSQLVLPPGTAAYQGVIDVRTTGQTT